MELLTILLSALLSILSPVGLIVDRVAENAIRDQLNSAEDLEVRVDNAPSYQLVQRRVDRVRIAGRGLFPVAGVRIAALEVETDAIAVTPDSLGGSIELEQPLQAGVRLVLNEADLNQALRSPTVRNLLQNLNLGQLAGGNSEQSYEVVDPQIELNQGRIRLQAVLQSRQTDISAEAENERLAIVLESGLAAQAGHQLRFVDPAVSINGQALPALLTQGFAAGISRQLDLQNIQDGITARILKLEITSDQLELAAFVRVPETSLISSHRH